MVDTWITYVKDQPTVIFCVSVEHAEKLAELLQARGVGAKAVSGAKPAERKAAMSGYEAGKVKVLWLPTMSTTTH